MARLEVEVPIEVAETLHQQARLLKLGRRDYVRALLCAVAADTDRLQADETAHEAVPA